MIKRVLIANRGEIALRVIRACRELGIESVAVFSDADRHAPHVLAADRAEHIGGSPAPESYLNIPALLDAARRSGADAVHPGYGFLSERAHFARACVDAGLIFVGPGAEAIERMGSKIGARQLMQQAGVPVVPGETPADQSDAALTASVSNIGFPALIKPSAGGGGIGMKTVRTQGEVLAAVQSARREAQAAFGDGTLYVERLVERPRHVEIQVFADRHGQVVHLFERECSIQRRHQKALEESPCPVLAPVVRQRMGDAAVAAARAAGYVNAGTIEFLLAGEGVDAQFFFLEMNTRLQVEHPVTEAVVGVDLVRAQLLVASGKPLPWSQESLSQRGHAIECRIYAEDPTAGFLPQAGRLLMYRAPEGPGIRVDAGVVEGSEVSVFYDPLLAKLIVSAETRATAIERAVAALRQYVVLGIRTNIPFLLAILQHPRFVAGEIDTSFLDAEGQALRETIGSEDMPMAGFAAAAAHLDDQRRDRGAPPAPAAADPFDTIGTWGVR
ncbi:MAG TPA: biotin carboxylase N-terminal domain-containing protein [Vicinamibacterales bacterium]|nr:biotin carboxylase N-terminal domain-containing protein [Vicinamibacterales bacterium]